MQRIVSAFVSNSVAYGNETFHSCHMRISVCNGDKVILRIFATTSDLIFTIIPDYHDQTRNVL